MHILLVEDDASLIDGLKYSLEKHNFKVDVAKTVLEALNIYEDHKYNLLVLDLTLPDGTGFEICKKIRLTSNVPIIFLTASDEEVNVVMGLDIGGDDYITKPFKLNELMSRINALLRRTEAVKSESEVTSNSITVELANHRALIKGQILDLTAMEYRLLCFLMYNPNVVLSREIILDRLWDTSSFVDDNTLSVYIRRLRNKIEDDPNHPQKLVTVRGIGYQWKVLDKE